MHRGSILCRKDPEDECEWQFCLKKKLEWTKEETRHEQKGDSSAKLECAQWLELKAKSLMPGEMVDANQAKLALAEVTGKGLPALMDKEGKKPLDKALTDLKELLKQGGKMTMDQAKQHLFDAALEIKKVKKAK